METRLVSLWTVAHSRQPELLDDPALPTGDHILALETLARINALSCTARQVANAIVRMLSQLPPRNGPLRVVDLASGGGDVTIALARRLNRPGALRQPDPVIPHCHVTGIDISPRSVDRATQLAKSSGAQGVSFLVRDIVTEGCPPCDIVTSSLFLHHLDDPSAEKVIRSLAGAAVLGGVLSDLIRSRVGLLLAVVGTTVLGRSKVARVDGPLSVRAARTLIEYRMLLNRAGLPTATLRRVWPPRVLLEWTSDPLTHMRQS